jgi:lactoylglutathione lyase
MIGPWFSDSILAALAYSRPMNTNLFGTRAPLGLQTLSAGLMLLAAGPAARAAESEFSKPTIDIGIVVKDAEKTARFLTNAIGFKEVRGFSVTSDLGKKIGLLNGQATEVRVFALDDAEPGTRVKVLSFPKEPGKQADQAFIHTTLGIRYLTLYVKNISRSLERLKAAGIPTLGETPVEVGTGTWLVAVKDPDGNFIELIGPRL